MNSVWSEPLTIYVAATIAVALALVEVALPTFGVAGLCGAATGVLAAWGIDERGLPWWPFVPIGFAFMLWAVELVRGTTTLRWFALGTFALGSLGFVVETNDLAAGLAALLMTALFALAFPSLGAAMGRLNSRPSDVGTDRFIGAEVTIDRWQDGAGTVLFEGSRWSAIGPHGLTPGSTAIIETVHGVTFQLAYASHTAT